MAKTPNPPEPNPPQPTKEDTGKKIKVNPEGVLSKFTRSLKPEFQGKGLEIENKAAKAKSRTRFEIDRAKEQGRRVKRGFLSFGSTLKDVPTLIKNLPQSIAQAFRVTDKKALLVRIGSPIVKPEFLQERFNVNFEVTNASRWTAALLLAFLIPLSLAIVEAFSMILTDVLLRSGDLGNYEPIMQFIVTALNLGSFILFSWLMFLWVRTGGFNLFAY